MMSERDTSSYQATCDLLVIGSGAAALTAALAAVVGGLRVIVVEKESRFGGASARSGGGLWLPEFEPDIVAGENAADVFLHHEAGPRANTPIIRAFVQNARKMRDFVEANSPVRFDLRAGLPDYHSESPGASTTGRVHFTRKWNAAPLGRELARLRRPLKSLTFLGVHIGTSDVAAFVSAGRNPRSMFYVLRLLLLRAWHQLMAGRSLRLVNGNALVGGLACAVLDRGVEIWTTTPARELLVDNDRVTGARVDGRLGRMEVHARCGVVLATGGFPHDQALRAAVMPRLSRTEESWGLLPLGNVADGIRMAEQVGGNFCHDVKHAAGLAPVTDLQVAEGVLQAFPCFQNRAKPGLIAVTRSGRRFVNEGLSYHDFAAALIDATPSGEDPMAWLVCDRRYLRRYGLGGVRPFPIPTRRQIRSGYLKTSATLEGLAVQCGIDPARLRQTVEHFNIHAGRGNDPEFGRGSTAYDRALGDSTQRPNPCVRPLDDPPFYAIRVVAGAVGTFAGLSVNADGRVLGDRGIPIPGLYAAGNDMASLTGGDYVAGGCTLGPGMTFGYLAGMHAAREGSVRGDAPAGKK